jgi:hypothetical protein
VLLALAFEEPGWEAVAARFDRFRSVFASDLLEAELRSALRREGLPFDHAMLRQIELIVPSRSLRAEFAAVLAAGYVRGADCFHLAVALSLAPDPRELTFLTLDKRQRDVAAALGFET